MKTSRVVLQNQTSWLREAFLQYGAIGLQVACRYKEEKTAFNVSTMVQGHCNKRMEVLKYERMGVMIQDLWN